MASGTAVLCEGTADRSFLRAALKLLGCTLEQSDRNFLPLPSPQHGRSAPTVVEMCKGARRIRIQPATKPDGTMNRESVFETAPTFITHLARLDEPRLGLMFDLDEDKAEEWRRTLEDGFKRRGRPLARVAGTSDYTCAMDGKSVFVVPVPVHNGGPPLPKGFVTGENLDGVLWAIVSEADAGLRASILKFLADCLRVSIKPSEKNATHASIAAIHAERGFDGLMDVLSDREPWAASFQIVLNRTGVEAALRKLVD